MRLTSYAQPLAAALLLGVGAVPLTAQATTSPRHVRPVVRPAALTANPAVRTVAAYRFLAPRAAGLPIEVILADSAGRLVGGFRTEGARTLQPLEVTVLETDIVLQAQSEAGLLTLRLAGQNDPSVRDIMGRWWLGGRSGELRGRLVR